MSQLFGHWRISADGMRIVHLKSGAAVYVSQVRHYREIPGAVEHACEAQTLDRQDVLHLVAALIEVLSERERTHASA